MVKAQCLWDVAIKKNSSIDSTNVLVANLKPLMATLVAGFTPLNYHFLIQITQCWNLWSYGHGSARSLRFERQHDNSAFLFFTTMIIGWLNCPLCFVNYSQQVLVLVSKQDMYLIFKPDANAFFLISSLVYNYMGSLVNNNRRR